MAMRILMPMAVVLGQEKITGIVCLVQCNSWILNRTSVYFIRRDTAIYGKRYAILRRDEK